MLVCLCFDMCIHMRIWLCACVYLYMYVCLSACLVGHFKQGLPVKTLAALRSSQALMLKVCGVLPHPQKCVFQPCCKERAYKACPLTEPGGVTQEPVKKYFLTYLLLFITIYLIHECNFYLKV